MKYRNKKDSLVKVSLIDEIGFNLSYNMAAKKQPWSNLNMRLRMKFKKFNNYTLNMNAVFATYAYTFDKSGNVIVGDRTEWSYGRFGRFQGWGSSINYTFNNDTWKKLFGKDKDNDQKEEKGRCRRRKKEILPVTKRLLRRGRKAQADRDGIRYLRCHGR